MQACAQFLNHNGRLANTVFSFKINKFSYTASNISFDGVKNFPVYKFSFVISIPKWFFKSTAFNNKKFRKLANGFAVSLMHLAENSGLMVDYEKDPFITIIDNTTLRITIYEALPATILKKLRDFFPYSYKRKSLTKEKRVEYMHTRKEILETRKILLEMAESINPTKE